MKKTNRLIGKKQNYGYIFVLPFIIGIAFFFVIPVIQSVRLSLGDAVPSEGFKIVFGGVENYAGIEAAGGIRRRFSCD